MSKVFIAWSGTTNIAKLLKDKIESTQGYHCLVGGNLHETNSIFVGGTIIEQMKKCDQAILLIQKKDSGRLSSNLMFEWGFLLAKLNANKIHNYFIDLSLNDDELPSDLHGVWAYSLKTENKTDDEVAEELAQKFFNSQRHTLNENKMSLIIERDKTRDKIIKHNINPDCSNYEMAQYILCYIYCSSIYGETRDEALADLLPFTYGSNKSESPELNLAISLAKTTINLFKSIRYVSDEQYIDIEKFYEFREAYEEIEDQADSLQDSDVKFLIIAYIKDFVSYLYLLIINCDEIDDSQLPDEKKAEYCHRLYKISEESVEYCNKLESAAPSINRQLCTLLRGYMYRDMFCALDCLEKLDRSNIVKSDLPEEERYEKIIYCLTKSLEERKQLYNEYKDRNVNSAFLNNIEMEYFLGLAEVRRYEKDEEKRKKMKEKLFRYVQRANKAASEKQVFTEKIRGYIED